MKILLIGIGRWGKNHYKTLTGLVDKVYVSDLDVSQLDGIQIEKGYFSTRYQDFLNEVDAVDIVTSTDGHLMICKECLYKNKDVFIEKPMTFTSEGAKELIEEAERKGLILQVGHVLRYHPASNKIKEFIKGGNLGNIKYAYGHFMEFKRPRTDVGVTQTDAIHFFDLFNYLLDMVPRTATAVIRNHLNLFYDDTSISILDYYGIMVTVETGYMSPEKRRDIVIVGDKGSLQCDFQKGSFIFYDNHHEIKGAKCVAEEGLMKRVPIGSDMPLTLELKSFLHSIQNRSKPLSDGWTGYKALKIVEACYESSRKRKTVDIEWN